MKSITLYKCKKCLFFEKEDRWNYRKKVNRYKNTNQWHNANPVGEQKECDDKNVELVKFIEVEKVIDFLEIQRRKMRHKRDTDTVEMLIDAFKEVVEEE